LFETAPANGSVCVILEATSADNMSALLEFMYKGEVHVSQKALESFLKAAESLQVSDYNTLAFFLTKILKVIFSFSG
jgi:GDNF-inducible zinc finger protein 1